MCTHRYEIRIIDDCFQHFLNAFTVLTVLNWLFLGWYIALKPKKGQEISPAALQSPTMKQASTSCTLHFYYNMYGEGISAMCKSSKHNALHKHAFKIKTWTFHADEAELNVVMIEGTQATTLWWQSVNHKDVWQPGIVTVGRMPQDFSIIFEGSRIFNKPGHVAIDDITFTNCSLPGSAVQPGLYFYHFFRG